MLRLISLIVLMTAGIACGPPAASQTRTPDRSPAQPAGCLEDSDCAANQFCSSELGRCDDLQAPECDLEAGDFCACSTDGDCPDGSYCNEQGLCELSASPNPNPVTPPEGCAQNTDCAANEECVEGACVERPEPQCRTDRQCPDGQR